MDNPRLVCPCNNTFSLEEGVQQGMVCPACGGMMSLVDNDQLADDMQQNRRESVRSAHPSPVRHNCSLVALITLPSRNVVDAEGVADLIRSFQLPIGLEIFGNGDRRYFLIRGSRPVLEFTASRLEAVYPKMMVRITEKDPVSAMLHRSDIRAVELPFCFQKPDWLPVKTWQTFTNGRDPVVSLLSAFSGLGKDEGVWFQLYLHGGGSPEWEAQVQKRLKVEAQRGYLVDESATMVSSPVQIRQPDNINYGVVASLVFGLAGLGTALYQYTFGSQLLASIIAIVSVFGFLFILRWLGRAREDEWDQTDLGLVRAKVVESHKMIRASLRVAAISPDDRRSLLLLQRFSSMLDQYSVSGGNSFSAYHYSRPFNIALVPVSGNEKDSPPRVWLSPGEIAGVWHPPLIDKRTSLDTVPVNSIAYRAPSPDDTGGLAPIGAARLPGGGEFEVSLNAQALRRGVTMVGKPGMGKSILMEHIIKISAEEDPEKPAVIVVDPHGDLAERLLGVLSPDVVRDRVYYLDVAAKDYIMTYNPLDPTQKGLDPQSIAQIFMDIGQALFGKYWGPRMQVPYKRTILTVAMANKKRGPGNMFGPNLITPFLMADNELWTEFIRQEIGEDEDMTEVLNMYYQGELAHINHHLKQQVIMPVLSKSDRFAEEPANSLYNAPKSDLDLWEVIENRKILIINTRSGIIGEDMAAFTGALFINAVVKIVMQQIASRSGRRIPITFVVDEMQTIAGVQWDTLLGQMRKHGFNLVIGTQSLASIRENLGTNMPGIILGGSHTLFSFRINGEDAEKLSSEEFRTDEGGVDPTTLTQLPPYHVWASMVGDDGKKIPPFSMRVKPPFEVDDDQVQAALDARARYSTPVSTASKRGLASLTYIRDHFGKLMSEGSGKLAAPSVKSSKAHAVSPPGKSVGQIRSEGETFISALLENDDDANKKEEYIQEELLLGYQEKLAARLNLVDKEGVAAEDPSLFDFSDEYEESSDE
jgi:hypothetical protein